MNNIELGIGNFVPQVDTKLQLESGVAISLSSRRPFEFTQSLIGFAASNGIFDRIIEGEPNVHKRVRLLEGIEMTMQYYSTDSTLRDAGSIFFLSSSEATRRRAMAINGILANLPEEFGVGFNINGLTLNKPTTLETRLLVSKAKGGKLREISQSVKLGSTAQGLKCEFGFGNPRLKRERQQFRKSGLGEVPYVRHGVGIKNDLQKLEKSQSHDDEQVQELLDRAPAKLVRTNSGKDGVFVFLSECAREAGLRCSWLNCDELMEFVRGKAPIAAKSFRRKDPVGREKSFRLRYSARADKERIVELLRSNRNFRKYKSANSASK